GDGDYVRGLRRHSSRAWWRFLQHEFSGTAAPHPVEAPMTNGVLECFRCHTPIPENSKFCSSCGADVSGGDGPTSTSSVAIVQERLRRVIEGKYRIERLLGKGGMGAVFLAHDLTLEREVAIKVLPPDVAQDDQVVRRFQQEAKTAAKLDHPNIIPIYRVESEGGLDRKSTRLNSSHRTISYAVFCLKKKKKKTKKHKMKN